MCAVKVLGTVTDSERDAIREVYTRKSALIELSMSLADRGAVSNELYERILNDMAATSQKMGAWWENTAAKYHWEYSKEDVWAIDFASRTVTIQTK